MTNAMTTPDTTTVREYGMNESIPATVTENGITYHLRTEPWMNLATDKRVAVYSRTMKRVSMFG